MIKTFDTGEDEGGDGEHEGDDGEHAVRLPSGEDMLIEDKMMLWQNKEMELEPSPQQQTPWDDGMDLDDGPRGFPGLHEYRDFLLRCSAYTWLRSAALKKIQLEQEELHSAQVDIQQAILDTFETPMFRERDHLVVHGMVFEFAWIRGFLERQDYDIPPHEALPRVIVLTGSENHSWATTCLRFVQIAWPETGQPVLELLVSLLQNEKEPSRCEFPNICRY